MLPTISTQFRRFHRDETGSMTFFALFMVVLMLLVGGIAVDLMRLEMERAARQNALDGAILAAANLEQELDPILVVEDYMSKSGFPGEAANIRVTQVNGRRTVSANSSIRVPTTYMNAMGTDSLPLHTASAASQSFQNIEVSLVLDISGSMNAGTKIQNLRAASTTFAETLLDPDVQSDVSISVVPYSEHVSLGPDIFNALMVQQLHNSSYCLDIPDALYTDTSLKLTTVYEQLQHFQWADYQTGNNTTNLPNCPTGVDQRVNPLSASLNDLRSQFGGMVGLGNTAIHQGARYGAALLDPASRPLVNELINTGAVDAEFTGRPADYDTDGTLKMMVIMSDGLNTSSFRIPRKVYRDHSDADAAVPTRGAAGLPGDSDELLVGPEFWLHNNLFYYIVNEIPSDQWDDFFYTRHDNAAGDALLQQVCNTAKANGIVIWSVGFEIDDTGAAVLESCATSPVHFFRVEGSDLESTFRAIALEALSLRLTL